MTLEEQAKLARWRVLDMIVNAGHGHIGSSLSAIELLVALYCKPLLNSRDEFIMSKGHACEALYAVLAAAERFDVALLDTYGKQGSVLSGETSHRVPGVKLTTGSVGHGLSVGAGIALAAKLDDDDKRTVVMLGDGECYEGAVWEAALFAAHHKLGNLVAIVDRNRMAILDSTEKITRLEPFAMKWLAFGWQVRQCANGHSFGSIQDAWETFDWDNRPKILIAETTKGKGVSFMEDRPEWHHGVPGGEELEIARKELAL